MQAKSRYFLLFISCIFLTCCYFGGHRFNKNVVSPSIDVTHIQYHQHDSIPAHLPSFLSNNEYNGAFHHSHARILTTDKKLGRHRSHSSSSTTSQKQRNSHTIVSPVYTNQTIAVVENSSYDQAKLNEFSSDVNEHIRKHQSKLCRMETCFDYSKCTEANHRFLVYVYPVETTNAVGNSPISLNYKKILSAITESRYYTSDPEQACLFVLGIDTLDRDLLSKDYVRNMPLRLARLPYWNNGRNHIIFNLYSGTWPDYAENSLGFDTGEAILAKASMSVRQIRPGFDVSIPLFHKEHPLRTGNSGYEATSHFLTNKTYLLAFKGKRYVHGIGSETRNSLFHLHNARDLILVTTCRHGKNWRELQDTRCDEHNREYDHYDYDALLLNSTFCLVPRGRRLGSFRFLETLQAGCIPVLLSNSWALPFESKIDWKLAIVRADERLLLQIPEIVRSISATEILAKRQQTQILWEQYFESIEKIVFATFEIIRERLPEYPQRNGLIWNNAPGALLTLPTFTDSPRQMPFLLNTLGQEPGHNFTAVIFVQFSYTTPSPVLCNLIKSIAHSQYAAKIVIIWSSNRSPPSKKRWPKTGHLPLHIISSIENYTQLTVAHRFHPLKFIETDAILSLDEDAVLNSDEIDFAYNVWRDFPDRIVGYPARTHFWDEPKNAWGYTSKWTNHYSIVLTGASFYHRYYNYLYANWLPVQLLSTVQEVSNCEDILMNFLVSHVTRKAPIKLTQRRSYTDKGSGSSKSLWNRQDHFKQRQGCLNSFADVFGYMPLLHSNVRFDPVLYGDSVSILRKKYRQTEVARV